MADELKELEKRIAKEYRNAMKELSAKYNEYISDFSDRWQKEFEAYQRGEYTKEQFIDWQYNQIGRGHHWLDLRDQMAQRLVESKKIASMYINDTLPKAYVKASNGIASLAKASAMEQGVTGIRFDLVDEHTIRNLMKKKSNVISFRTVYDNPERDYKWNSERIQNAVLQGILQGDSIEDFTGRFLLVMENNRNSAIRNARTAVTCARNAGKQDRFDDLASQGCELTKIWVATHDKRVRDAHKNADGQEVPYDEPFYVDNEYLAYPADSSASPANVYNCRCTMRMGKIKFHSVLDEEKRKKANIRIVEE